MEELGSPPNHCPKVFAKFSLVVINYQGQLKEIESLLSYTKWNQIKLSNISCFEIMLHYGTRMQRSGHVTI